MALFDDFRNKLEGARRKAWAYALGSGQKGRSGATAIAELLRSMVEDDDPEVAQLIVSNSSGIGSGRDLNPNPYFDVLKSSFPTGWTLTIQNGSQTQSEIVSVITDGERGVNALRFTNSDSSISLDLDFESPFIQVHPDWIYGLETSVRIADTTGSTQYVAYIDWYDKDQSLVGSKTIASLGAGVGSNNTWTLDFDSSNAVNGGGDSTVRYAKIRFDIIVEEGNDLDLDFAALRRVNELVMFYLGGSISGASAATNYWIDFDETAANRSGAGVTATRAFQTSYANGNTEWVAPYDMDIQVGGKVGWSGGPHTAAVIINLNGSSEFVYANRQASDSNVNAADRVAEGSPVTVPVSKGDVLKMRVRHNGGSASTESVAGGLYNDDGTQWWVKEVPRW